MSEKEFDAIADDFNSDVITDAVAAFDNSVPTAFKGLLKVKE